MCCSQVAQLLELWGGPGIFVKLLKVYNETGVGAVMIGGGAPNRTCENSPSCRIRVRNELQREVAHICPDYPDYFDCYKGGREGGEGGGTMVNLFGNTPVPLLSSTGARC